jgi:hypothetical protein
MFWETKVKLSSSLEEGIMSFGQHGLPAATEALLMPQKNRRLVQHPVLSRLMATLHAWWGPGSPTLFGLHAENDLVANNKARLICLSWQF